jgi:hypothetical protein
MTSCPSLSSSLLGQLLVAITLLLSFTSASLARRNVHSHLQQNPNGDEIFALGNLTYLANLKHPRVLLHDGCDEPGDTTGTLVPFTVVVTDQQIITASYLQGIVSSYVIGDDVYTEDFLEGIYLASNGSGNVSLDPSAISYLQGVSISYLYLDTAFSAHKKDFISSFNTTFVAGLAGSCLPPGPYLASMKTNSISFASVYLLYRDSYRDFLYGVYDTNDGNGTHSSVGVFNAQFWAPMIPVPSRIYYWNDPRPLAGKRVAVKDLFDIKGLVTSGGSQAWAYITPPANITAPCIQQIVSRTCLY